MKLKKSLALIALLTALCLTLQGCVAIGLGSLVGLTQSILLDDDSVTVYDDGPVIPDDGGSGPLLPSSGQTEKPDAPDTPATAPSVNTDDPALVRWANYGSRDFAEEKPLDLVSFSQMEYVHPDMDAFCAAFDEVISACETSIETEDLLQMYYGAYDRYISFYSMNALAQIRYSIDTTDTFYKEEYEYCEAQAPTAEEKLEAMYKALGASDYRKPLERAYFGDGFFDYYDDYEVYTNETYLRLAEEEQDLLAQYRTVLEDPVIKYKGQERSYWELLENAQGMEYNNVLQAYYEQYNPVIGDLFLKIVRVRKQLAETLGYDDYAEYAYEMTYSRDYTAAQGRQFVEDIRTYICPVYSDLIGSPAYYTSYAVSQQSASEQEVRSFVRSAAENLGGTVIDAYRFMDAYQLSDITQSQEKQDTSFQIYIYDYEAPFVMVNSTGKVSDYTTFAHEFGHFTDAYYTYSADEDLETAETFSQAMEFLALTHNDVLSVDTRDKLLKRQLVDTVDTFITQAAFASFEDRVYSLSDSELTVDRVNEIYRQVTKDFGYYERDYDVFYSLAWIDIPHFFEAPFYVISYCVSADTSLQVYMLEDENPGAGVGAYFRLLDREYGAGVQQVMTDAGLENPFRRGSLEKTAEFYRQALDLD